MQIPVPELPLLGQLTRQFVITELPELGQLTGGCSRVSENMQMAHTSRHVPHGDGSLAFLAPGSYLASTQSSRAPWRTQ